MSIFVVKIMADLDRDNVIENVNLPAILSGDKFFKIISINENNTTNGEVSNGKIKAKCLLCNQTKRHTIISGNLKATTNFKTHLKRLHPQEIVKLEKYKAEIKIQGKRTKTTQQDEQQPVRKQLKLCSFDINRNKNSALASPLIQKTFDQNVYNYVIRSMKPLSTVDDPNFIKIITDLQCGLQIMSRRTLGRRIDDNMVKLKIELKSKFKSVDFICTTADIWSTRTRSFMGITAHWINDKNLERQSAVLACRRFKGVHSYDRIADMLFEVQSEYDLQNSQIVSTVTDNGANFVKAYKEFGILLNTHEEKPSNNSNSMSSDLNIGENEDSEEIMFESSVEPPLLGTETDTSARGYSYLAYHLRCASHTLSLLATTDFTKALKASLTATRIHHPCLAKCSALWNAARRPKSAEIIFDILHCKLQFPCVTRWNFLFDAISQLLNYKNEINNVNDKLGLPRFKEVELQYLDEYCTVFKPIATALDLMQSESNCYYGVLLPTLISLRNRLNMLLEIHLRHLSVVTVQLVNSLTNRFKHFYSLTTEVNEAILATCFHPCFKMRWLPETVNENDRKRIHDLCLNCLEPFSVTQTQQSSDEDSEENFFIFNSSETQQKEKHLSSVEYELTQFFNDRGKNFNTLDSYPSIKKAFIRYNTSLCSSAPVERLFSFAGFIHSPTRGALSDEQFENLVYLKGNLNYLKTSA